MGSRAGAGRRAAGRPLRTGDVITVDGVSAGAGLAAIAWSPDGAQVAFGGGAGQLDALDVRGGAVRRHRHGRW
jgi:hypothetical protein